MKVDEMASLAFGAAKMVATPPEAEIVSIETKAADALEMTVYNAQNTHSVTAVPFRDSSTIVSLVAKTRAALPSVDLLLTIELFLLRSGTHCWPINL